MERVERAQHVIDYRPRERFAPFHDRLERWAVIVAHRRAGKTVATINDKIRRAITCALPHGRYAYVAPFLAQAKEVAWEYLKRFSDPIQRAKSNSQVRSTNSGTPESIWSAPHKAAATRLRRSIPRQARSTSRTTQGIQPTATV